jgi:hypothetical protein
MTVITNPLSGERITIGARRLPGVFDLALFMRDFERERQ